MSSSDWMGAIGVGITLLAYFCMTFNLLSAQSRVFFLLNTVGAALTCISSYLIDYWPVFVLEGTWALVSLAGLIKARSTY